MTQYHPITAEVIAQLEQVVPGRVVVGEDVNPDYARDGMLRARHPSYHPGRWHRPGGRLHPHLRRRGYLYH